MELVLKNPYRVLGLLSGITAREQERQIRRLRHFIEAEEIPDDDFSFQKLGTLNRSIDNINLSTSKLNLDIDKLTSALFWFYKGNVITDEPAFEALKEGDLNQVLNIWEKLTSIIEISKKNSSAYNNLGTLYLSGILDGKESNEAIFEKGISLKLKFLESDSIKEFKSSITDETFKISKKEIQILFLNELFKNIQTNNKISTLQLITILNKINFCAKEDFFNEFTKKPIEEIERVINETEKKRKEKKANSNIFGEELFDKTKEDIKQLKSILGINHLQYKLICDKLADEILQCGIDYFKYCQKNKSEIDYFEPAYSLVKKSELIAIGSVVKDRVKENMISLESMKYKELSQAIQLLQSIKDIYIEAIKKIDKQVEDMQYINTGTFKLPNPNVSINWSKVDELKKNALNWDKIIDLILKEIPSENVAKIEKVDNLIEKNKYKELVNFIFSNLSYFQKNKIRYICYWEDQGSVPTPTIQDVHNMPDWVKWAVGIILFIILINTCN